jgi:multidrug efflux pump subunit AcrA (membrane-fusion protein)
MTPTTIGAPMGGPLGDGRSVPAELPALRLVRSPRAARVLALVLLALGVMLAVGLVVVPWQQSVTGHGRVIAWSPVERQQRLEAPVDGRIARVPVIEGQVVDEGEVIFSIADVDPRFLERLESEQQLARVRLSAAESRQGSVADRVAALQQSREMAMAAAMARVDMARERVRQAEQAVVAAAAARETADLNLPRIVDLAAKGLRSTRDRELAELDAARARAEEQRARAASTAAQSEVESLLADRSRIDKDTLAALNDAKAQEQVARAEIVAASAEIVRLDTRIARQQTQAVTAPRDAIVFRVLAQEGQLVKQGDSLAELVPQTTSRAVEIWVDGVDAPLVTVGRHVRLQFEGWPALQFTGWPQAARGTFGGEVAFVDAHDDGHGRFRVVIVPTEAEPWPNASVLRQGVRANGWVLLDRVSAGYEIWRRLNAFPPSLQSSPYDSADNKGGGTGGSKGGSKGGDKAAGTKK